MPGRSAERRDQRVVVSVHEQVEIAAYVTADQRGGGVLAALREVRDVGLGYAAACHDRPRCSARPPGRARSACYRHCSSGPTIRFAGVDLIDGTPVIDLKPYVTRFDLPGGSCSTTHRQPEIGTTRPPPRPRGHRPGGYGRYR